MPKPGFRPKDIAQAADDAIIARAALFVVNWFLGRPDKVVGRLSRSEMWRREEFPTLAAARAARNAVPPDAQGRRGMIYASAFEGSREITVFVDDGYEARAEQRARGEVVVASY